MVHGPVREYRLAINIWPPHGPEHARIVGAIAMIAHDKIISRGNPHRWIARAIEVVPRNIRLLQFFSFHVHVTGANLNRLAGQADDAFDERFRVVYRIPENDHVPALDGLEAVDELVDEDALLIAKERGHAGAFHFDRLI